MIKAELLKARDGLELQQSEIEELNGAPVLLPGGPGHSPIYPRIPSPVFPWVGLWSTLEVPMVVLLILLGTLVKSLWLPCCSFRNSCTKCILSDVPGKIVKAHRSMQDITATKHREGMHACCLLCVVALLICCICSRVPPRSAAPGPAHSAAAKRFFSQQRGKQRECDETAPCTFADMAREPKPAHLEQVGALLAECGHHQGLLKLPPRMDGLSSSM